MPALTLCRAIDVIIPMAPLRRGRIRCSQTIISASGIRWRSDANCRHKKRSNERGRCRRPPDSPRHDPLPASWLSAIELHSNCACNAAKAGLDWRAICPNSVAVIRLASDHFWHIGRSCLLIAGFRRLGRSRASALPALQRQARKNSPTSLTRSNCPVGLSLIGWPGGDEVLLDLAVSLARHCGIVGVFPSN